MSCDFITLSRLSLFKFFGEVSMFSSIFAVWNFFSPLVMLLVFSGDLPGVMKGGLEPAGVNGVEFDAATG